MAVGTLISGFWILSANSWMQTPAGYSIAPDGRFMPEDWWAIVFNPSFPFRYLHTITGAYLTTAMIVGAVGAFHVLRDRGNERARLMFSMAMWMAVVVAPAQAVFGDMQGLCALHYQPQKVAAMEGHWETQRGAAADPVRHPGHGEGGDQAGGRDPLSRQPDPAARPGRRNPGLKDFPQAHRPTNVPLVFWSFRIMVGMGVLMIALGLSSLGCAGAGGCTTPPGSSAGRWRWGRPG